MRYECYFFDLYGTLADIWTDERKSSLWRGTAAFYSLCGASYTARELRERYLALCAEETAALAAAHPELGEAGVEIELRSVFRRLFEEKGIKFRTELYVTNQLVNCDRSLLIRILRNLLLNAS